MPLIGWWKLDGDAYDSSPSRNNGDMTGVSYSSTYGKIGQGGNFTGSGRVGTSGGSNIVFTNYAITTHHTVAFWMYCHGAGGPTDGMLLGTFNTVTDFMYAANGVRFRVNSGTSSDWTVDTDFQNKWRHVTLLFKTNKIQLFLDGVDKGDAAATYDGTYNIDSIGACHTTTSYDFDGYLNDVRIYDHKLSVKEIEELARAKVLHYQFSHEKNTSGDLVLDSSGYERHATLNSSKPTWTPFPPASGIGSYEWATASFDDIQLTSSEFPIDFGTSISISVWYYAGTVAGAWETLVHGTTSGGWSTSYWLAKYSANTARFSINGSYTAFNPGFVADTWHHIFATYDGANTNVYINGVQKLTNHSYTSAIANENGIKLGLEGQGINYDLDGKLADLRVYNRGYNSTDGLAEALRLYQTSASLDADGNLHTRVLQEGGHETKTLADYTTWVAGTDTPTGWTNYQGTVGESTKVEDTDPWGRSTIVWTCIPTGTGGQDGGFYSPHLAIDNTKLYRFSVWSRRTTLGTAGRQFMGMDSDVDVQRLSTGDGDTNPYFWLSPSTPDETYTPDEWILVVGHCFPYATTTGTADHPESGRYHPSTGIHYTSGGSYNWDFRWASTSADGWIRCIFYNDTAGTARMRYVYPRIDLVDGTEPSIADLLSGNYYDPDYANDITNIGKNGTAVSTKFSEMGPTEDLIGYWPLNGTMEDFSGNERDGYGGDGDSSNHGNTSTPAIVYDDTVRKSPYLFNGAADTIELDNHPSISLLTLTKWSISLWAKKSSYGTHAICANTLYWGSPSGGRITFTSPTNMLFSFGDGTTANITISTPSTTDWYNLIITHEDDNEISIYEDGSLINTPVILAGSFYINRIGNNSNNSSYDAFDGHMLDFRIYQKVLTTVEMEILGKMYNKDGVKNTEIQIGGDGWYTYSEFQEDL